MIKSNKCFHRFFCANVNAKPIKIPSTLYNDRQYFHTKDIPEKTEASRCGKRSNLFIESLKHNIRIHFKSHYTVIRSGISPHHFFSTFFLFFFFHHQFIEHEENNVKLFKQIANFIKIMKKQKARYLCLWLWTVSDAQARNIGNSFDLIIEGGEKVSFKVSMRLFILLLVMRLAKVK